MLQEILHLLPPETAHKLTLWGLSKGFAPKQPAAGAPVTLFGKQLKGRVGLSGGADKNAEAIHGWQDIGFAFVELGTVTLKRRTGNPGPRIWRQKEKRSLVNWMGLPNLGAAEVAQNVKAYRARAGEDFCVGVSVASPDGKPEELCEIAAMLAPYVDFFTFNASCPNVAGHAASDAYEALIRQLKATIGGAGGKPVLVKLAPTRDEEALRSTALQLAGAGAAGFVACNTLPHALSLLADSSLLPTPWPQNEGTAVGGYSGPALLDISTAMVRTIRSAVGADKVIIGVGGIASAMDARRMLENGADLVQLYTGLVYQGPKLLKDINEALD